MSLYDYQQSQRIDAEGYGFDALIMAAMRHADDFNMVKLESMFPELHCELAERYNAPGGVIPSDDVKVAAPVITSVTTCKLESLAIDHLCKGCMKRKTCPDVGLNGICFNYDEET